MLAFLGPLLVRLLDRPSSPSEKTDQKQYQEHHKADLRDPAGRGSYPTETENRSDQRNNQKHPGIPQHRIVSSDRRCALSGPEFPLS